MRIISGEFRGSLLPSPPDRQTRPITDRVKASLFDSLMGELPGAIVLDLFAGTGSLGLEALSRGAQGAVFVERRVRVAALLLSTIERFDLADRTRVRIADAYDPPRSTFEGSEGYTMVFVDPPFRMASAVAGGDPLGRLMLKLGSGDLLADKAVVILRHDRRSSVAETFGQLKMDKHRKYGSMVLRWYRSVGH